MNSLEDSKDVLHTILVNELRNVYNIKYHKDATKGKKLNTVCRHLLTLSDAKNKNIESSRSPNPQRVESSTCHCRTCSSPMLSW